MKALILLFNKLRHARFFLYKSNIIIVCAIIVFIGVSCRIHHNATVSSGLESESSWGFRAFDIFGTREDPYYPVKIISAQSSTQSNSPQVLGVEFQPKSCPSSDTTVSDLRFKLKFVSIVGEHEAVMELSSDVDNDGAKIIIDDGVILLGSISRPSAEEVRSLCDEASFSDGVISINSDNLEQLVNSWLSFVAPDCKFTMSADRWSCEIDAMSATLATSELEEIQTTMLRRWSRQPYLLVRRMAITSQLANIVELSEDNSEISKLCKMISNSQPEELPLVVNSKKWQKAVCGETPYRRLDNVKVGLTKSFSEIEFLRRLFEQSSNLGLLQVSVPRSKLTSRDLFVSLTPEADVSRIITDQSMILTGKNVVTHTGEFETPKACWHPIFGVDPQQMQIAKHLDLIGEITNISCVASISDGQNHQKLMEATTQYLADSIVSETEFIITNGNSKILRLPPGTYGYKIRERSHKIHDDEEEAVDVNETIGRISWSSKKPNVSIREW